MKQTAKLNLESIFQSCIYELAAFICLLQMFGMLLLLVFDHLFVYYASIHNIEFTLSRINIQINVTLQMLKSS